MSGLTQKQEDFCLAYVETSNASEAYRRAYSSNSMLDSTVWRNACAVMKNTKVQARIAELQGEIAADTKNKVSDLLAQLEETYQAAMKDGAFTPAVNALMGKAKILGHDKPDAHLDKEIKRLEIQRRKLELQQLSEGSKPQEPVTKIEIEVIGGQIATPHDDTASS